MYIGLESVGQVRFLYGLFVAEGLTPAGFRI